METSRPVIFEAIRASFAAAYDALVENPADRVRLPQLIGAVVYRVHFVSRVTCVDVNCVECRARGTPSPRNFGRTRYCNSRLSICSNRNDGCSFITTWNFGRVSINTATNSHLLNTKLFCDGCRSTACFFSLKSYGHLAEKNELLRCPSSLSGGSTGAELRSY
jgi:hypothetical protein